MSKQALSVSTNIEVPYHAPTVKSLRNHRGRDWMFYHFCYHRAAIPIVSTLSSRYMHGEGIEPPMDHFDPVS